MDLISNLAHGFSVALSMDNLIACFIGALLGTFIGVLPGFGPVATIAVLLPITFHLEPVSALIMLAGIYYGAQYGGSITAILANLPGEASSVITCIDGYKLAQKGRAGAALAIAALASFLAGTFSTLVIAAASPLLASFALEFKAPEYFALMVLGLIGAIVLARGSVLKAIIMVVLGLLLGLVGMDVNTGVPRMTLGFFPLLEGISFTAVAMGIFGLAEIMVNLEQKQSSGISNRIGSLFPDRKELKQATPAAIRGTLIGSALGILPGGGALLASFAAYAVEKNVSKDPSRFGNGAIEGVAAPEAANNAGAQTSFIPMLTLGIPSNPVMALMIGAMALQGLTPGPGVMTQAPDLFWGVIASMWIGNIMLLIINLPLVGIWVSFLKIPYKILYPTVMIVCCIGAFSLSNSVFDVLVMAVFSVIGYILLKLGFELAPLVLGFILGPMLEENFRRAMMVSRGSAATFVTSPISVTLLTIALVLLISTALPSIRRKRESIFVE